MIRLFVNSFYRYSSFILVFILWFAFTAESVAQKWTKLEKGRLESRSLTRQIIPEKYDVYSIDVNEFKQQLKTAPKRFQDVSDGIVINIPLPNDTLEKFILKRSDVFHPELAAKYPEIQSYSGTGIDDPSATIKISISHLGLHGMIMSSQHPTVYIDKYANETPNSYLVYNSTDFHKHLLEGEGHCQVEHPNDGHKDTSSDLRYGDCQLRKFRLALACTGEYANYHGGTIASVLAEYNASLNRINGIYEKDFGIIMELIPNTDALIYLDPNTDPYSNNNGFLMLTENQNNINSVIGLSNYDIGHVYSTGGGGIAEFRSPCTNKRARGVTGLGNPTGDPFWVDYVAHEMGHQFGGNHTFNNECAFGGGPPNINENTAFEPGSGTTIMAYAGICTPNIQNNGDDYFHSITQQEVANFVIAGNGSCAEIIDISNTAPELESPFGNNHILPTETPFALSAVGSDSDGDVLTYCWEQWDNEVVSMPPESDAIGGPAFRSYPPTENPTRYFPRLNSILYGGNTNTWEKLPSVDRDMNFNITVRDNHFGVGCTANDDISVSFTSMAGPFQMTSQNTATTWNAGSTETITWDVANTNQAPVSCNMVDIWLSIDGGQTFDILIADNIPNDGEEIIDVPMQFSSTCRLMVKCATSIFLDINDREFSILAPFYSIINPTSSSVCKDQQAIYTIDYVKFSEDDFTVSFDLEGLPTSASYEFSPPSVIEDQQITLTISNLDFLAAGNYNLLVKTMSDVLDADQNIELIIGSDEVSDVNQIAPNDAELNVNPSPILTWEPQDGITNYSIELAKNPAFKITDLVHQANTDETFIPVSGLDPETVYYWRVRSNSQCIDSEWGDMRSFQTGGLTCNNEIITVDEEISSTESDIIENTITIESTQILAKTEISLIVDHDYVGDLSASIQAPNGTIISLFDQVGVPASQFGCNQSNLSLAFSDTAISTAEDLETYCSEVGLGLDGAFQPIDMLSILNGQLINGDWKVIVEDAVSPNGGEFLNWVLTTCHVSNILAGTLLTNAPLEMLDVIEANITNQHLTIEHVNPENTQFILRSTPSNGSISLLNEASGLYSTLEVGSIFTQEDINMERVKYQLTIPTTNSDTFLFDTKDDENRYTAINVFLINANFTPLSATAAIVDNILCFGDETGSIAIIPAGGSAPYTYSIDGINYVIDSLFTDLPIGNYAPSVKGIDGTVFNLTEINLSQPAQLSADLIFGTNDVTINASGGEGDYSYSLDGTIYSSIKVISLMDGQTYTIYVKDENQCVLVLPEFTHYHISAADIAVQNVDCKSYATGSITINAVTGGLSPYTYKIDGQSNPDNNFTNLTAGTYEIKILDDSGKEFIIEVAVDEPLEILTLENIVDENTLTLNANGGTEQYTYSIDDLSYSSNNIFENLASGAYIGYVLDSNGCKASDENIIISTSTVDPSQEDLTIYPNPANKQVTIGGPSHLIINYEIIDIAGRKIKAGITNANNSISLINIPNGTYMIRLSYDRLFKHMKLVVIQ